MSTTNVETFVDCPVSFLINESLICKCKRYELQDHIKEHLDALQRKINMLTREIENCERIKEEISKYIVN